MMDEIYRSSYQHMWKDKGDWYLELIYGNETVQKELSQSLSNYFFVEWGEEKIGILKYDFPFSPKEIEISNAMKLHRLYLHPKAHGKGIAQILMKHCEQVAKENELHAIWLEVMECKPQAKRFYQKNGFAPLHYYKLNFGKILPEYSGIEIWSKVICPDSKTC